MANVKGQALVKGLPKTEINWPGLTYGGLTTRLSEVGTPMDA